VIATASGIGVSSAAALRLAPSQVSQTPATRTAAQTEVEPGGDGLTSTNASRLRPSAAAATPLAHSAPARRAALGRSAVTTAIASTEQVSTAIQKAGLSMLPPGAIISIHSVKSRQIATLTPSRPRRIRVTRLVAAPGMSSRAGRNAAIDRVSPPAMT
jgi:hypothetical protein